MTRRCYDEPTPAAIKPTNHSTRSGCLAPARRSSASNALELENVEPSIRVGEIHSPGAIDVAVAGLDDLGPVGTRIHHVRRIWRDIVTDLAGLERVLDVIRAHARIVVGREDQPRALE